VEATVGTEALEVVVAVVVRARQVGLYKKNAH
jgi:hypothetical protein